MTLRTHGHSRAGGVAPDAKCTRCPVRNPCGGYDPDM